MDGEQVVQSGRVKGFFHWVHRQLARGLVYLWRSFVALLRALFLFVRGAAPYVALFAAAHYLSHAYVAAERDVSRYVVETAEAKIDETAERWGYERPAPPEPELDVRAIVEQESLRAGVNPRFVMALMRTESSEDPDAYSPKGAIGLMQIMPFNYKRCKLKSPADLLDKRKNIRCGVQIIDEELEFFDDDPDPAAQAYNGGRGCVNVCKESILHAKKVLKKFMHDVG